MEFFNSVKDVLIITLVLVIAIAVLSIFIVSMLSVPFVPTRRRILNQMLNIANLKSEDIVFDLGSGDGRAVIEAAQRGVKSAVGFEINVFLFLWSWLLSKIFRLKNSKFILKSFWNADLSKPTKIFVYLLPLTMQKLEEKILAEAQDGLVVVSNTFKFKNIEPERVLEKEKIYLYIIRK